MSAAALAGARGSPRLIVQQTALPSRTTTPSWRRTRVREAPPLPAPRRAADADGRLHAGSADVPSRFKGVARYGKFRRFSVTTEESEESELRAGRRDKACGPYALNRREYRKVPRRDHQSVFTAPESWIAPSRVTRGSPTLRAAAQMSPSKGSRVKRSSSARNTCSAVVSSGW